MKIKEAKPLVHHIEKLCSENKKLVLFTIVAVEGSSYRHEDAKLLIGDDRSMTGAISGGCLEPALAGMSAEFLKKGTPELCYFDLQEDDTLWGYSLGCPGKITLYIEPVLSVHEDIPLLSWIESIKKNVPSVFAKVIDSEKKKEIGTRLLIREHGQIVGGVEDSQLKAEIIKFAEKKLQEVNPLSELRTFKSNYHSCQVFFDVTCNPIELLLFGAGFDAISLARLAVELGFHVMVIDPNPKYANIQRFPSASVLVGPSSIAEDQALIGQRTYIVIMNHHLQRDKESLLVSFNSKAPYIGALGPYSRWERIISELNDTGFEPTDEDLGRLYNPVGLNIGAETPEEIAISILSEILAIHNRVSGGFLKGYKGKIHKRIEV